MNSLRIFFNTVKSIFVKLLPFFSLLIPKKKNLWIFGAWQGKQYSDNSKFMFEYVSMNHPEIEAVWITRSNDVVDIITSKKMKYKDETLENLVNSKTWEKSQEES